MRYGSIGGGSRVRSPPEADTFTAVHSEFAGFGICLVLRRSSMTMKAHTYYVIFGRPPIGGKLPPSRLAAPSCLTQIDVVLRRLRDKLTYHHINDACTRSLAGDGSGHWWGTHPLDYQLFLFFYLLCKTPPSLASFKSRLVLPIPSG